MVSGSTATSPNAPGANWSVSTPLTTTSTRVDGRDPPDRLRIHRRHDGHDVGRRRGPPLQGPGDQPPDPRARAGDAARGERLGIDELDEPADRRGRQVAGHRELADVDDIPGPGPHEVVDRREQSAARIGLVTSPGGRQPATDEVRLDRAREGGDAPRPRDEVNLVEHRLEGRPGLLDPLEWCGAHERQAMVAEPAEQVEGDERGALHQVEWRRPVDDKDVQSHGTTAATFDAIQCSEVARPGCRRRFDSTKRSQ